MSASTITKCSISEIFGPTIQGEGLFTGVPSIFVRFNGCNLRCCFKGGSICDTAYTSHKPEPPEYSTVQDAYSAIENLLQKFPHVTHIVFTGGEPMLQQEAMAYLIENLRNNYDLTYTVETNGTCKIKECMEGRVDLWSISPKLSNSCYFDGHDIPQERKLYHLTHRINHIALAGYLGDAEVQIKFVYTDKETEQEIKDFEDDLTDLIAILGSSADDNFRGILIMPEGETREQITATSPDAIRACINNGWRFCDRTHIRIWDNKRKV